MPYFPGCGLSEADYAYLEAVLHQRSQRQPGYSRAYFRTTDDWLDAMRSFAEEGGDGGVSYFNRGGVDYFNGDLDALFDFWKDCIGEY